MAWNSFSTRAKNAIIINRLLKKDAKKILMKRLRVLKKKFEFGYHTQVIMVKISFETYLGKFNVTSLCS